MKIFDLFCGTGGFSKGFENTGCFEVVHGVDVLKVARSTFASNHPSAFAVASDIRNVRRKDVADHLGIGRGGVGVIIGGPPCQGFSSIRPFRSSNEDDPRNSLFEEFASYVNYFRPPVFVMENVVGLATHKGGATLDIILETFSSLGYECEWKILNAALFGVPQKRERLILIGTQPGIPVRFPMPTHSGPVLNTIGYRDHSHLLGRERGNDQQLTIFDAGGPCDTEMSSTVGGEPYVTVDDAISDLPAVASGQAADCYIMEPLNGYQAARRQNVSQELTLHSSTAHTKKMLEIIRHAGPNIYSLPPGMVSSGFSSSYSRLSADEPSVTITVNFVHPASNRCIHPSQDRALTPREGARLQSFDDDFLFCGNRTQIVKQIGNAVPPLLGRAIAASVAQGLGLATPAEG